METMYKLQMSSKCSSTCVYSLGVAPSQDASDHQEYHIFSRGSQPKPSFATGILGGGHPECILLTRRGLDELMTIIFPQAPPYRHFWLVSTKTYDVFGRGSQA